MYYRVHLCKKTKKYIVQYVDSSSVQDIESFTSEIKASARCRGLNHKLRDDGRSLNPILR